MKKRIKKKNRKKLFRKTLEEVCKKELAKLKYGCERRDEDIAALREELTAYKQLLRASQINFEWAMHKLIGDGESIEIPLPELKPNTEFSLAPTRDEKNNCIVVKKIKLVQNSPDFTKNP